MIPLVLAQVPPEVAHRAMLVGSILLFVTTAAAVYLGYRPLGRFLLRQERLYDRVLRGNLLMDISPRTVTVLSLLGVLATGAMGYLLTRGSALGAMIGAAVGLSLPALTLRYLQRKRLSRLEDQIVAGVQTLASGVRAGLNLVQSMEMISRDGPSPLRQEFTHLLREYEYGVPLDDAMANAAVRIGSSDFRLLFAALQTHRERGGDLGQTLDRIAASIREIQRLEKRVEALTAQGRATARWLGAMPGVVMLIFYFIVDAKAAATLFTDPLGNVILVGIGLMNVLGFLWIRKIVSVDV